MHSRTFAASILSCILGLALTACGGSDGSRETIQAVLTADQETTATPSSAFGTAEFTLDRGLRLLSATASFDGVAPTLAHVHAGVAGVDGPVAIPLQISAHGATLAPTPVTDEQIAALDAGALYINVHSANHPAGEIRGQLGREVFKAVLTGQQETDAVDTAASGDGRLILNPETRELTGDIEVRGMTATAAHVHTGALGSNGAIAITLENHGDHGHFSVPAGTVLDTQQVDALRSGGFYFNVHSAAHTTGEIRGQIGRRVLTAAASGAQEVPPNASTASGRGLIEFDPRSRTLTGRLTLAGLQATAAHLHAAPAGSNGPILVTLSESPAGSGTWIVPDHTKLTPEQARLLLTDGVYFNAHSGAFPAGEVRGQAVVQ